MWVFDEAATDKILDCVVREDRGNSLARIAQTSRDLATLCRSALELLHYYEVLAAIDRVVPLTLFSSIWRRLWVWGIWNAVCAVPGVTTILFVAGRDARLTDT